MLSHNAGLVILSVTDFRLRISTFLSDVDVGFVKSRCPPLTATTANKTMVVNAHSLTVNPGFRTPCPLLWFRIVNPNANHFKKMQKIKTKLKTCCGH